MSRLEEFSRWVLECNGNQYTASDTYADKEEAVKYLFYRVLRYQSCGEAEIDIELNGKIMDMSTGESWPVSALGNIIIEEDYEIDKVEFGDIIGYDPGKHPSQVQLEEIIARETKEKV